MTNPIFCWLFQRNVVKTVRKLPAPAIFSRELSIIDFEEIDGGPNPTFFGMVREPVARFKSSYNFYKATG